MQKMQIKKAVSNSKYNVSELQERFHGAALMAPAVYWRNAEDSMVLFSYLIDLFEDIFEDMGKYHQYKLVISNLRSYFRYFVPIRPQ